MLGTRWISTVLLTASLGLLVSAASPQGKGKGGGGDDKGRGGDARGVSRGSDQGQGKGKGQAKGGGPGQAKGKAQGRGGEPARGRSDQRIERQQEREFAGDVPRRSDFLDNRGARKRFLRQVAVNDLRPRLRQFFVTDRLPQRIAVGAVARANLRGVDDDVLVITPVADRVRILNRSGVVLLDLDEARARDLGRWEVIALDERVTEGAPSFCRSGAGHPVFGRQWCLDKEFGLGADADLRWARTLRLDDVVFLQPVTTATLARDALISVLGPVAFDRLALHAITLGLIDPLIGRWLGEPSGSRVLLLTSGGRPVAEIVDIDRDDRAEVMVVALRDW